MKARDVQAAYGELQERLKAIGGCSDGYCIILRPVGMHTNGGCRCRLDMLKMQRYAYAHNQFADAIKRALSPIDDRGIKAIDDFESPGGGTL